MNPDDEILFIVTTPLGFAVRATRRYWQPITTVKHPVMAGHEADVQATLSDPEEIRRSRSDENALLFYRTPRTGTLGVRRDPAAGRRRIFHHRLSHRRNQGRNPPMADLNIYHDPNGHTLTVWFGAPQSEHICEETGDEVILMKDKHGRVIGFERLNYRPKSALPIRLAFETLPKAG